ncbi:dTDP-4-dehydrorhamnose 3,5-epimerase [Reichenbachiella faecimaris]|uniref:dTDP-4-dehydrorhamnose 3,5-epimerase n=1 Tax=Reichenbachiella faecimaris TaxID=692418 RepID=A0A1W2GCC3_REIFA|nr:dTDP-4-dehydrorhamnose 3,5-epimerase [Reichenbachiella faecimaris]SMD34305.1 dTDP-4-dehydrorhamnose 3,5-epimerase [Reichenbachiella faecimaris]
MKIEALPLSGAFQISPKIHIDNRGYFFEWFNQEGFKKETGVSFQPVQFNASKSTKGVLRGMHFQVAPHAQAKLVTATKGEIQDVIIDVRKDSPTFGQHYSMILSESKKNQLYVPKGFAHGFLVLSEEAEIFYAIDNFYAPQYEDGICHDDQELKIDWLLDKNEIILSDRDKKYGAFKSAILEF